MRTQGCREAMDKVQELCGISDETLKKTEPVTELCKTKTNAPLRRCATGALLPITKIKNASIRNAVISEANQILRQRNDDGEFIKERLTQPEIEELIVKHQPKSKKAIVTEKPPRFKLNKSQHNVLKRMVSLKIVANEREAFPLIFVWAAERITKKK
jgi:hypothetical protein